MANINVKPDICDVRMSDIKPAPYNPREISPESLAGLRQSLEKFGMVDLLVVNKRNMHIISGHQRFKILLYVFSQFWTLRSNLSLQIAPDQGHCFVG